MNIALGAPGCPSCGVQFAPVQATVAPSYAPVGAQPHAVAAAPPVVTYATLWDRFLAGIIDVLIINVPFWVIFGFSGGDAPDSGWSVGVSDWLSMLAGCIYTVAMISSERQATLGMKVMKLRVVRDGSLEQLTTARAFGRWAASIISMVIIMIGYLMIAFTKKRQGLHDLLAETVVVRDLERIS